MNPSQIINLLQEILEDIEIQLDNKTPLVGSDSAVDSMSLVQLCLKLEEAALIEGFSFDWTSEKAMSRLNSTFRSPQSIADEFNRQLISSKKDSE